MYRLKSDIACSCCGGRFSPDPQLDMHTYDVNTIEEQHWKLETTKQRKAVCLQSMKSKDSKKYARFKTAA